MKLSHRQNSLVRLLKALGGSVGKLDFQKLLFLYCQGLGSKSPYEFVPYKYGAFSFASYADLRKLTQRGYLVDQDQTWTLVDSSDKGAVSMFDESISDFLKRHRSLRGNALIEETYKRFPYYAINSTLAENILQNDKHTLRDIVDARPKASPHSLSTIGYEGRSLDSYLNLLLRSGVTLLCDVRRNAISRKYGFSKSTLKNACENVDIDYWHLPALGISSVRRRVIKSNIERINLIREYRELDLPKLLDVLEVVAERIRAGAHVALTCFEGNAAECHRGPVSLALRRILGQESTISNL